MEYLEAKREDLEQIYQLVHDTIQTVYPRYYPREIVDFFSNLHAKDAIAADIESGCVRVLFLGDCLVGTGTFSGNHISRLFVLPVFQKKGYGSCINCPGKVIDTGCDKMATQGATAKAPSPFV